MDSAKLESAEGHNEKRPYHEPRLSAYGSMRDLTKTGIGALSGDNTSPYNVANQS